MKILRNRQGSGKKTGKTSTRKWQESGKKPAGIWSFSKLVGFGRFMAKIIYNYCQKSRSKITDSITLEELSELVGHSKGSIKQRFRAWRRKEL